MGRGEDGRWGEGVCRRGGRVSRNLGEEAALAPGRDEAVFGRSAGPVWGAVDSGWHGHEQTCSHPGEDVFPPSG